jgi:hypothetical protein
MTCAFRGIICGEAKSKIVFEGEVSPSAHSQRAAPEE